MNNNYYYYYYNQLNILVFDKSVNCVVIIFHVWCAVFMYNPHIISQNRFEGCVYSAGTQLATAENENLTTYLYSFSRSGDVYFGSNDACENNPPMKIAIYVVGMQV